jgi:hypothetical protein
MGMLQADFTDICQLHPIKCSLSASTALFHFTEYIEEFSLGSMNKQNSDFKILQNVESAIIILKIRMITLDLDQTTYKLNLHGFVILYSTVKNRSALMR